MRNVSLKNQDNYFFTMVVKVCPHWFCRNDSKSGLHKSVLDLGNSLFAYLLFSILPHFNVFAAQDLGTPFQYLHSQVLESTVSGTTPLPLSVQEVQVFNGSIHPPSKRGMGLI